MGELSHRKVEALKEPGRYSDGDNLYLQITKRGTKSWLFMYRWQGKQKEMGIGPFPAISLADARVAAEAARRCLKDRANPQDPMAVRRAAKAAAALLPTFGVFAEEVIASLESQWKNQKHKAQWRFTLREYAKPIFDMPVDQVDTDAVLSVLRPIWSRVPETANRVRSRIEKVLDAATAKGHRQGVNPARWRGHLDHLLPARQKLSRGHHAAMPYSEVPSFVTALRSRQAVTALALEFLILTAARSGEVLGMTWSEADLEAGVWTVPASRMKAGREHRVPLTERATAILSLVAPLSGQVNPSGPVFRGPRGRALSVMSLTMQMRRMGRGDVTPHGFRSSFRDWAGEVSEFPREIAEAALAHVVGDQTERAYRRGDAIEKRRLMMNEWEKFIQTK